MTSIDRKETEARAKQTSKRKQWLWFVGLWCLGFCSVGLVALIVKGIIKMAAP